MSNRHRSAVPTFDDLPMNDPVGVVRRVIADGKLYQNIWNKCIVRSQKWAVFGATRTPLGNEEDETPEPPTPPVSVIPPSIDDTTPTAGQTLTRVAGTATGVPAPTATYSWLNATTLVEVGTGTTLLVTAADFVTANGVSAPVKVIETWTNSEGSDADESSPTSDVTSAPFDCAINLDNAGAGAFQVVSVSLECKAMPAATIGLGEWFLDGTPTGETNPESYTTPDSVGSTYSWRGVVTNALGSTAEIESNIGTIT